MYGPWATEQPIEKKCIYCAQESSALIKIIYTKIMWKQLIPLNFSYNLRLISLLASDSLSNTIASPVTWSSTVCLNLKMAELNIQYIENMDKDSKNPDFRSSSVRCVKFCIEISHTLYMFVYFITFGRGVHLICILL